MADDVIVVDRVALKLTLTFDV